MPLTLTCLELYSPNANNYTGLFVKKEICKVHHLYLKKLPIPLYRREGGGRLPLPLYI